MKRITLLAVSFVALWVLTACGGEQAETEPMPLPTPIATYAFVSSEADASDATSEIAEEIISETDTEETAEEPTEEEATGDETTAEEEPADTEADAEEAAEEPAAEEMTDDEATAEEEPADTEEAAEEPVEEDAASDEVTAEEEPADTEPADEDAASDEATAEEAAADDEIDDPYVGLPAGVAAAMENADPSHGEQLTLQNACIGCHSFDPDVQMVGPTWHNLAETAPTRVEGQSAIEYLYASIVDPNAYVADGFSPNIMVPTYGDTLSDQDLADIITYLLEAGE